MTICIAAIYEEVAVLGASDRMITAGGYIKFEPTKPKIWPLTSSITSMVADDIFIHTEIYRRIKAIVNKKIDENPHEWIEVQEIADIYSQIYCQIRKERISREILEPIGLNYNSFIARQREMSDEFIASLKENIINYRMGNISTIITGIDSAGPHIYTLRNSAITCNDWLGFSVIGVGANHAASHFMLSGHTRNNIGSRTLLIAHQAKRKAEVAPGVGKGTDMFLIGPQLGTFNWVKKDWIAELDRIYSAGVKRVENSAKKSEAEVSEFIEEQAKKMKSEKQVAEKKENENKEEETKTS